MTAKLFAGLGFTWDTSQCFLGKDVTYAKTCGKGQSNMPITSC